MELTEEQEPLETIDSRTFVASPEDLLSGEAHVLINCHRDECTEGDIRTSRQDSEESCESTSALLRSLSSEVVPKGENEEQSTSLEDINCNSQVLNERTDEDPDTSSGLLYIQDCNLPEESQQSQMLIMSNQRESNSKNASRMFECEYVGCGRTFTTAAHLRYHMRTHTGEKPFCCTHEGCGRNFTSSGYLRYHQCTHSGKRTFKCQHPRCERVFAWPAHLKYHMKTHTGDRAYRCTFEGCNKSFYVLQRLNVHMRVHTGERPYTCAVENCNKSFTTQGNLKNHMRIHTGERPYSCPVEGCGRTFTEHSSLRKHKLTHTGEKPYVCELCGKTFSQSGSRNAHQKRHAADSTKQDRRPKKSNKYVTSVIVQGDDEIQQGQMLENLDGAGGDQEQSITSQALVFSQAEHAIVTQAGGDQLVLAQPIVAKEVSIETTPVQPMSLLVQTTDDPMVGHDSLVQATADVVSLAETVVAQQTVIHTMLDGATIIPTTSQSGLAMVDHVLQPSDVEHMMQSVVSQHILSGHIQLPLSAGELEQSPAQVQERDRDPPPLTVDMTGYIQQTQEQARREDDEDHGLDQGECVGVCGDEQQSTKLEIRQDLEYQED